MRELKGLATGIGSLPHIDVKESLDLVFRYVPNIPFWPQLPKRNIREGMVIQFSERLPCLKLTPYGFTYTSADREKELEKFYEKIISQEMRYFEISRNYALGLHEFHARLKTGSEALAKIDYLKCHITGPFTFAASIKDEKELALLHDPVFLQAIIKGLIMKALWQINFLAEFKKKIIIFIDEPYLGCFGSAYTPINREDVVRGLTETAEGIKSENVLVGVHCCGNTDWSIFTDVPAINIINFDAFSFLDKFILYADNLKEFMKRGGTICWGIVPTQEFTGDETADSLVKKLMDGIDLLVKKGLNRDSLLNSLVISPSCGLGTLAADKADKIFGLLYEMSLKIRTGA